MHTFGPLIVVEPRTLRPVVGRVATVTTLDGDPIDTYDLDGNPAPVVTGSRGQIAQFRADPVSIIQVTVPGGDPSVLVSMEAIAEAGSVADIIDTGRLSEGSLAAMFVKEGDRRLVPLAPGEDDQWRVRDEAGTVALAVDERGRTRVGMTTHTEALPGWRVLDAEGHVAIEVDERGRTHIYDLASTADEEITTLHVFIAAGQSNMSGRGLPLNAPVCGRVMQYGANRRVLEAATVPLDMVDAASGTSPASFFAHNYLGAQPSHVGVLLVPAARGATAFVGTPDNQTSGWTWTKGAADDPEHALYERSVEQAIGAIAAAQAAGYLVVLKGVLWHQGEGNSGTSPSTYADRLDALIADYRADLDAPDLPVVVGQMCPEGIAASGAGREAIDAVHRATPSRVPHTGFAPATRDGHLPGDTTHFDSTGTAYLGDTYLTGYLQALGNAHPTT